SRGLRGGSSLARLLAQHRGRRNHLDLPQLSQKKILEWMDAHHEHKGEWPNTNSGEVVDAPGERWKLIDDALREGRRGLLGGSSLAKLLASHGAELTASESSVRHRSVSGGVPPLADHPSPQLS